MRREVPRPCDWIISLDEAYADSEHHVVRAIVLRHTHWQSRLRLGPPSTGVSMLVTPGL
jgi:hypothetical protein